MSNVKMGIDCCGDRYACDTTRKCFCGCGLFYCRSCFLEHMLAVARILTRAIPKERRARLLQREIKEQRKADD